MQGSTVTGNRGHIQVQGFIVTADRKQEQVTGDRGKLQVQVSIVTGNRGQAECR